MSTATRLTLASVTVTFNRLARLQASLPRLLEDAQAGAPGSTVMVVDNASTDGTADWLATLQNPCLRVLTLPENTGGAGGFEVGMRALAEAEDPDWTLLLDDDAWPEKGATLALIETVSACDSPTAPLGAVAAAVRLPDGRIAEMNRPGFNPFWAPRMIWATLTRGNRVGFKLPDAAYAADAPVREIDNASFVGYAVSREGRTRIGPPEGGLFIYGDDVLYSLMLRRAGLRILFAPQVRFVHDCGTMGEGFIYRPLWKAYYHCRNGVAIARAAAGPVIFPLALLWYTALWVRRGRHYPAAERRLYGSMLRRGLWDGLLWRRGRADHIHRMTALSQERSRG